MNRPQDGPVEQPSMANGAQVALDSFNIPQFPREAGGLLALTLVSQISTDQYRDVLRKSFKVTHLPPSIQSLTLESFTLGYPAGFLKALIQELPELRSLVVYSQTFSGLSEETSEDAVAFIKGAKKLRALHLLDAPVSSGFVEGIAPVVKELEKPLMFFEISYAMRAGDETLLDRIPAAELPLLIHHGLISCTFNISPPEVKTKYPLAVGTLKEGIEVLPFQLSKSLISRLLDENSAPKVMKHLNITLYSINIDQLQQILAKHKGLMVLNISLEVTNADSYKKELLDALVTASNLEQVEIVLISRSEIVELDVFIDPQDQDALSRACKKLSSFKINQRRCQQSKSSLECTIIDGKWQVETRKPRITSVPARLKQEKRKPKQPWSPWI